MCLIAADAVAGGHVSKASWRDHVARIEASNATIGDALRLQVETDKWSKKPPKKWLDLGFSQIVNRSWVVWHLARGVDPESRRDPLPRYLREMIARRDKYTCGICHRRFMPDERWHIDHIIPYSKGGPDCPSNLRVTHQRCNLRRGNRDLRKT